jgi:hypothetical protein
MLFVVSTCFCAFPVVSARVVKNSYSFNSKKPSRSSDDGAYPSGCEHCGPGRFDLRKLEKFLVVLVPGFQNLCTSRTEHGKNNVIAELVQQTGE